MVTVLVSVGKMTGKSGVSRRDVGQRKEKFSFCLKDRIFIGLKRKLES